MLSSFSVCYGELGEYAGQYFLHCYSAWILLSFSHTWIEVIGVGKQIKAVDCYLVHVMMKGSFVDLSLIVLIYFCGQVSFGHFFHYHVKPLLYILHYLKGNHQDKVT